MAPSRTRAAPRIRSPCIGRSACRTASNGFRFGQRHAVGLRASASPACCRSGPDLVVSGINNGANMGDDNAVLPAPSPRRWKGFFGIPAIAVLTGAKGWDDLDAAARVARSVIGTCCARRDACAVAAQRQHPRTVPMPTHCRRVVTRLGRRHASEPLIHQTSPRGDAMYWDRPGRRRARAGPGTDFHATASGQVSNHALAGRPHRPRHAARLARLAGAGRVMSGEARRAAKFPLRLDDTRKTCESGPRRQARTGAAPAPKAAGPPLPRRARCFATAATGWRHAHTDASHRAAPVGHRPRLVEMRRRKCRTPDAGQRQPRRGAACHGHGAAPSLRRCRAWSRRPTKTTSLPIGHGQTISKPVGGGAR